MYIIGFDGLVRAGKTTLIKDKIGPLLDAVIIDEYGVYAKGSKSFPEFPPLSYERALVASQFFMDIEEQRVVDLQAKVLHKEFALVDRTHLSCLGFDYAARHFTGFDTFSDVESLWSKTKKIEPDIVIFLDVSHKKLEERIAPHKDKFLQHFYDRSFNLHISEFLKLECRKNPHIVRVDADQEQDAVQEEVLKIIRAFYGNKL